MLWKMGDGSGDLRKFRGKRLNGGLIRLELNRVVLVV
jgi:hypothetical protein